MERTRARRRRLALGTLAALAVAGFVVGAIAGGGSGGPSGGGRSKARCAGQGSTAAGAAGRGPTAGGGAGQGSSAGGATGRGSTAGGAAGRRSTAGGAGGCAPGESGSGTAGGSEASRPTLAERLTPGELAGERVVVSIDGAGLTSELRHAIHAGEVAGVVLFEADFPSRAAGRELIAAVQAVPRPEPLRGLPLLVMTDQEGGEVKRVDGAPEASAAQMGAEGPAYSRRQGKATAANLKGLGVNVDLAPVLDVGRPGGVIADTGRAFGETAAQVARSAVPFAEGLQGGGVAATAKHFPGLGTATENTDFEAQRLGLSKAELRAVDMAPYRDYIAAGGKLVMISTAIYPAFSPRPAAFTKRIVTGELRRRLGFKGVTITDSLGSAAVAEFGGQLEAAVDGASAGDDLLLFDDLPSALAGHAALVKQLRAGALKRAPFLAAVSRVLTLRRGLTQ